MSDNETELAGGMEYWDTERVERVRIRTVRDDTVMVVSVGHKPPVDDTPPLGDIDKDEARRRLDPLRELGTHTDDDRDVLDAISEEVGIDPEWR